jgi:hypothetical protein
MAVGGYFILLAAFSPKTSPCRRSILRATHQITGKRVESQS